MRIVVLQPDYPQQGTPAAAQSCIQWMSEQLARLERGSCDLVLLPEYANCPGIDGAETLRQFAIGEGAEFVAHVSRQSQRVGALIAVGTISDVGGTLRNRSILFGPRGEQLGWYDKVHLTGAERDRLGMAPGCDSAVIEWNGLRLTFAVCFDLYFPEYIERLASQRIDLLLCPAYQRSESAERILFSCQCRAMDTGAYLVRSSYAMGTPETGGHSLVASPEGKVLIDAGAEAGICRIDIDPKQRFVKPASFGQPPVEHRKLIEENRRPGLYRPRADWSAALKASPFPRLCAHRGLSRACPENTLPAFGAALAVGAHEIEFDLWLSRDGVPVVCHDSNFLRTTDGGGKVMEMDWRQIRELDAGVKLGETWRGTRIPRFEEVADLVDGRAGMNIHIQDPGPSGLLVQTVCDILREQGLLGVAYVAGDETILRVAETYAPEVSRACLASQKSPSEQIETALRHSCERIQFARCATADDLRQARDAGILCNLFFSNDPEDARNWVRMGIDVVLTDCADFLFSSGFARANRRTDERSEWVNAEKEDR